MLYKTFLISKKNSMFDPSYFDSLKKITYTNKNKFKNFKKFKWPRYKLRKKNAY